MSQVLQALRFQLSGRGGWKGRTSQEEKWPGQRQGVSTVYGRLLGATGWAGNRFLFVAEREVEMVGGAL